MTPGNMVTRVKAMKLSNRAVPYSNAWFKKNLNYDPDAVKGDADCDGAGYNGNEATAGGTSDGNEQSKIDSTEKNNRLQQIFGGKAPQRKVNSRNTKAPDGFESTWITTVSFQNSGKTKSVKVHKALASKVKACMDDINKIGFAINEINGYSWRCVNNGTGTTTLSYHAFGCAIDINWSVNPFIHGGKPASSGDSNTKIRTWNSPIVKIMNKHGFGWGGKYGDYMHFSYLGGA